MSSRVSVSFVIMVASPSLDQLTHKIPDVIYFHVGDLNGPVRFPDVALHFRARDVTDPRSVLHRMTEIVHRLAQRIGGSLRATGGETEQAVIIQTELPDAA
jgi:hypothetical protein